MASPIPLLITGALLGGCVLIGETPTDPTRSPTTTEPRTTTTTGFRQCVKVTGDGDPVATGSVSGDALHLSGELFICADEVVVVDIGDLNEVAAAAQLAAAVGGPLLHPHSQLAAELGRLKPHRVHLVGSAEVTVPPTAEVSRLDIDAAVDLAKEALEVSTEVGIPATADHSTVIETVYAILARDRVVRPETPSSAKSIPIDPLLVIEGLALPTGSEVAWLVDAADPVALLSAAATGRAVGASVVPFDPSDLLAHPQVGEALGGRPVEAVRLVGVEAALDDWELRVLANGVQLPGGGFRVFPEDGLRRYVAFYGHPETTALGALGEQGPEETLARMQPLLDAYTADGAQTIPTFEMIASVASAVATDDEDYSFEWPVATFEEWVRVAEESGAYIVLDLQPGREDFLTQAKQYQALLELPYVGLALDPEWRLKPDQVHLRQVGQVQAAEVNQVVHWLADLVREKGLPQKMLIVHQFQTRMIVDRETLEQRPELAMVIQMDGQGPIPTKDETWAVLTRGTEDAHWMWGWKNFFDEDEPTPTPEHTMGKRPVVVFVSYQ